jgi:parallel beta-helix repeat protein
MGFHGVGRHIIAVSMLLISIMLIPDACLAVTVSLTRGMSIIGIPSATSSTFSSCDLLYLNSSTRKSCQYSKSGPFVMYDTAYKTGDQTDCGNAYRSAASMQPGTGYFLRMNRSCEVSFTPPAIIDMTLKLGMDIISAPARTTADDIARICGSKDAIFGYMKSSSSSCWYDDHGYFIGYNGSINNTGDCGSNYISTDTMEPYVGYFVRFLGKNGDGKSPCYLRFTNGVLTEAPLSTTTSIGQTTTSRSTTTTITPRSSTTSMKTTTTKQITTTSVASGSVVVVDSTIVLTQSFDGGGKTYKHGPNLGDMPLFSLTGSNVVLSNVIIDDGDQSYGTYAAIAIGGTDNIVQDVTVDHCQRYGVVFTQATRGIARRVTILKAQHGISGSSGSTGVWNPSVDCIIENCNIRGQIIDGIKLKNMLRTIVRNNTIDVYPFNPGYVNIPTTDARYGEVYTKSGIYVASTDTASKDCIIENNTVFQSAQSSYSNIGILANQDQTRDLTVFSSGNRITKNTISGMWKGIWLRGSNYYVALNSITSVVYQIDNDGNNNTIV